MRIVGIETSGTGSQVALAEDGQLRFAWADTVGRRHAQELVPALKKLLSRSDWQPGDLDLVAVSVGPGSYTGLRVGITCAKTLAYAAKLDVLGIGTPETIAQNAPPEAEQVDVIIDAQRSEVYATRFRRAGDATWRVEEPGTVIIAADEWASRVEPDTLLLGPGLTRHRDRFASVGRVGEEALWAPRVEVLIQLAWRDYQAGRRMDLHALAPVYLRKSAAEEKWDQLHPSR